MLESDSDSDAVPGPGHYTQASTFKVDHKPERLQYFGSTVDRFTEGVKKKQNQTLGPGYYDHDMSRSF
jgi:hypothetical protein